MTDRSRPLNKRELQEALQNALWRLREVREETGLNLGPAKAGIYRIIVNGKQQGDDVHLIPGDTLNVMWAHGDRPTSVTITFEPRPEWHKPVDGLRQ